MAFRLFFKCKYFRSSKNQDYIHFDCLEYVKIYDNQFLKFGPCQIISGFSFFCQTSCPYLSSLIFRVKLFSLCQNRFLPVLFRLYYFLFISLSTIVSIPVFTTDSFSIIPFNNYYYTCSLPGHCCWSSIQYSKQ